jgi:hypothetical protein
MEICSWWECKCSLPSPPDSVLLSWEKDWCSLTPENIGVSFLLLTQRNDTCGRALCVLRGKNLTKVVPFKFCPMDAANFGHMDVISSGFKDF